MQTLQRTIPRSTRTLRSLPSRRSASHDSHTHHSAPKTESFGTGFYIALSAIPFSILLYNYTAQGQTKKPYFTRWIADKYDDYQRMFTERNDLHVRAIEQAASDRVLFLNESASGAKHVEIKFPEKIHAGAPWNVPAGHGGNIEEAIAKFKKEAYEENERRLQLLKDTKVPVEQPFESLQQSVSSQ